MTKEHKKILSNVSKKQSLLEALTGCPAEIIIVAIIGITVLLINIGISYVFTKSHSEMVNSKFDFIIMGAVLCVLEILAIGILSMIFMKVIALVLLANRRYLPLTKEEILALPFENAEEFYDFVLSVCSVNVPVLGRCFAWSNLMRRDIIKMVNTYTEVHNTTLRGMPDDLCKWLYSPECLF